LLAESIEFTTCEGAHISKMLTIYDYKRRSEGSCNCHITTKLILAAEKFIVHKCFCRVARMFIYVFIRKEPWSEKLTPSLNPGRWDFDAPDPGLWEKITLYIYI